MSYLYGDSTPSPLEVNFIEFLRDALDFGVQVLQATDRIRQGTDRAGALKRAADAEAERLEKLGGVVSLAVEGVPAGDAEGPTARCAGAIVKSTAELVKTEVANVRQSLAAEVARIEAQAGREREACVKALEVLLLRHDLPDTQLTLSLSYASGKYVARLRATTPFGIIAMLEVDIPSAHLFGHVLRLDRVMERLEVMAPDAGGWLHKEVKLRPQRLEKLHVVDLSIGVGESVLKLRANPDGTGSGFDIIVRPESPRVRMTRVGEQGETAGPPFDVSDADQGKVLALYDKLENSAIELTKRRKSLAQVSLDNHNLRDHDNPAVLVERLVQVMAPVVNEIAWRSRSATELILKRLLADDRREEIFVTKAELTKKLEPLPANLRKVFDPLGLDEGDAAPRPTLPARKPPTLPPRAPIRPTPAPMVIAGPATPSPTVLTSEQTSAAGGEIKIEEADDDARTGEHKPADEVTIRRD